MRTITIFVYRGGLRHWQNFRGPKFVWDPAGSEFIGPAPQVPVSAKLVDTHAFSGLTLLQTTQELAKIGITVESMYSDGYPLVGVNQLPPPPRFAPLISISGKPGSGKSGLAYSLAESLGARYLKWAKFVDSPGTFGENANRAESEDPFVFAKKVLPVVLSEDVTQPLVLDGIKDVSALTFVGFASNRPVIPLFVELPEAFRLENIRARGDSDDAYDNARAALFAERFENLRKRSLVVDLAASDHGVALLALAAHGLKLSGGFRKTLLDKRAAVWLPLYTATHSGKGVLPVFPEDLVFHTSYSDSYGLHGDLARRVNVVASAFRIIDDIVDEHEVRRLHRPRGIELRDADWKKTSPWVAIMRAASMLAWAARIEPGDKNFPTMVQRVASATLLELESDLRSEPLSVDEYNLTLDKEVAFREWLAQLTGQDIGLARQSAVIAQKKNDRYSTDRDATRLAKINL